MARSQHTVLGIMSGSSLDGVDLAVCSFVLDPALGDPVVSWSMVAATTEEYPEAWQERLRAAVELTAPDLLQLQADLGRWIGEKARAFLDRYPDHQPRLAGCHGHTVYHDPARGFSLQLGDGARLAAALQMPVVTDLRSGDIATGGQGAPLAPVADRHLYPDYGAFLNLGGIANISLRCPDGRYVAGDVSGCCQILDRLAAEAGLPYDAGGQLARTGNHLPELAAAIEALDYHTQPYPKSLGNDWVVDRLWPLLRDFPAPVADRLFTFTEWLAGTIADDLLLQLHKTGGGAGAMEVLVSGGGAHNTFLIERLRTTQAGDAGFDFVVADDAYTSDYKEAALIALCALLRAEGLPNSLASATGADFDTINGALYLPPAVQPTADDPRQLAALPFGTTSEDLI